MCIYNRIYITNSEFIKHAYTNTCFSCWDEDLLQDIYYAYGIEARRIFNFADNRIANLTTEEQNVMHTRMRGKTALSFCKQPENAEATR